MSFCDPQLLELRKRKFILVGTEQNNNAQFLSNYSLISLKKKINNNNVLYRNIH